jgi:hypothetical protein
LETRSARHGSWITLRAAFPFLVRRAVEAILPELGRDFGFPYLEEPRILLIRLDTSPWRHHTPMETAS